jgi:hypothetical protein
VARRRARRADSSRAHKGPTQVQLIAGHTGGLGHQLASLLALSPSLIHRLNVWEEIWASELGDLDSDVARWLDDGAELARLVQLEAEQAGQDVQVIYFHDRSRNPRRGSLGPPAADR